MQALEAAIAKEDKGVTREVWGERADLMKELGWDHWEVLARQVRKRHFLRHLCIKCFILPRHAQDKHRESTQKRMAFSYRAWLHASRTSTSPSDHSDHAW